MSRDIWLEIERIMGNHEYMTGVDRSPERVRLTAEVFTPTSLVLEVMRNVPIEHFRPGRAVLDPACGDGQFLYAAKLVKMMWFAVDEVVALDDIYGVDLMRDNVDLCRRRLGGGTIIMGDVLRPTSHLEGQSDQEHQLMTSLFGPELSFGAATRTSFRKPPRVLSGTIWDDLTPDGGEAAA